MEYYKIAHPNGNFSMGGYKPWFSAKGKTWNKMSDVRRHLLEISRTPALRLIYDSCQVIKSTFVLKSEENSDVKTVLEEMSKQQLAATNAAAERRRKFHEAAELKEFERLKAKFTTL